MIRRTAFVLGTSLLALLSLACQQGAQEGASPGAVSEAAQAAAASGEVAAEIDGVVITTGELDAWAKEDLFRRNASNPPDLHALREAALEAMLEEKILEAAARARGVTPEQVIAAEVEALGPVADEEVKTFFDQNQGQMGGVTLEQVGERVRDFLQARREADARAALREKANIVIHLEPPRVQVAGDGPSRGPDDAPITIVEFSDFQCPFCQRALPTLEQVLERYPGQVRVVYRNLPLRSHSRARPAAEAALCADEQGRFWPYHDVLFENTRQLEDDDLLRYAGEVGLDANAFKSCYDEKRFAEQVNADMAAARAAGANGTPAFFVNGVLLSGAKPPADFYRVIDAELTRLGKS